MSRSSPLGFFPILYWMLTVVCLSGAAWGENGPGRQAPYLGAAVEIREVSISPNEKHGDTRGLRLSFRYRVGRVTADRALHLVAHLSTRGGQKVRSLIGDKTFRDRDGLLHGKQQLLTVPRNQWKKGSFFVPFYAMKLTEGHHELSLHFSALSDTGSCATGQEPRPVKLIGETSTRVTLSKPPFKMVQILAQQVTVTKEKTDISIFRSHKARPDLKWRILFKGISEQVIHESDVRDDSTTATWNQYSPEFPFSQGDRLTLSVLDEDVIRHDHLGSLKLTLEELLQLEDHPAKLKAGSSELRLGRTKVR